METEELKSQNDLESIFIKYNRLIYCYVYLFFYSKETAEDLAQETFIRAWKYRETYNSDKSSLKTWLITIARSLCFDYAKKRKYPTELPEEPVDNNNLEKTVTEELLKEYIYSRLTLLSEIDKDLLILRFYNELAIEEIALVTGKTYDATKMALSRAFSKLKELINNENK